VRIDRNPAFFRAFHALAVDDGGGRAGFPFGQFPTLDVELVVDAIERAVVVPAAEIVIRGAARRQIPRQRGPLAAGRQDVHQMVTNDPAERNNEVAGLIHAERL